MRRLATLLGLGTALSIAALGGGPASPSADAAAQGTQVTLRASEFGPMIWGPGRQAVYVFSKERRGQPRCYGACARNWPPLLTRGRPVARPGVRSDLLGRVRRRGGNFQVTYRGRPLYAYAHEGPGQVLCHDIFLNDGWWYAVGRNGKRRP